MSGESTQSGRATRLWTSNSAIACTQRFERGARQNERGELVPEEREKKR